jgi:hypothetical protein
MEPLHSGVIFLYEPGSENFQHLRVEFYRDRELRLSLLHSTHKRRFSKALFTDGNWGEITCRGQTYTVTEKISLDVVLGESEKRICVNFGIIAVQD